MTSSIFMAGATSIPMLLGSILLLLATCRAIQQRKNPRRLILWGLVHDLGILCFALTGLNGTALTGLCLFALFQLAARALAWASLSSLTSLTGLNGLTGLTDTAGPDSANAATVSAPKGDANLALEQLTGLGSTRPVPAALFALGMLAAVGGTPFLMPEGRALIVQGVVQAAFVPGILPLLIMAAATTVFIWLYVDMVRRVWLEPLPAEAALPRSLSPAPANSAAWPPVHVLLLAAVVILLGVGRSYVTDFVGNFFHFHLTHSDVHPVYWCLYGGAFVSGLCALLKPRLAAFAGVAFSAVALSLATVWDATPRTHLFLLMLTLVGFVVSIYSMTYIRERQGWYWFFLLLTFASLAGIVSSHDHKSLYGYWELMTFASYFLVVHEGRRTAFDAGLKYYVMCAGGAVFMLPGLIMLDAFAAAPLSALQMPVWFQLALLLCLAGFGVKAGLVPLHSWLPDAHPAAPSSVSGPLSGVITKMGIFGIVSVIIMGTGRVLTEQAGLFGLSWFGTGLTGMGIATLVYGELMALRQDDIKRMLAYSTLGQIGEIALVLGIGTWLSTSGALWHMFNHAIMKDLLFLGAGALILRTGSRKLVHLRGLGRQMPWTVACMAVGLVSIMGLPPFGAFYSKFLMVQASVEAGQIWLAVLILLGSLVGAVYYTRILKTLVFEPRPDNLPQVQEVSLSMRCALVILAGLSLLTGLCPQLVMNLVTPVASQCAVMPAAAPGILAAMHIHWPYYVILPVFGALVPAFFWRSRIKAGVASIVVLLSTAALVVLFGQELDTLSYCFALLVPLVGAVNMGYALGYMEHSHTQWRFYCVFTTMCGGLVGMVSSQYLLSFFLFWEVMSSWTLYMAIAHEGDAASLREAFKYFLFNLIGANFLFVAVCLLGPATPFNTGLLNGLTPHLTPLTAWTGVALLSIGFVMKAAQLPIRIDWQMHPALAPTPVSGYISSVLLKSAIVGLIKLFMLLGGGFAALGVLGTLELGTVSVLTMWIGGITIVLAAFLALRANGVKLIFIYSTVSQLGYMVLAVAAGGALGYAGGMLHLVNHVFFKDLLFLICGAVMFASHKDSLDDLGGIGRKMPFTLLMFAIGGLSVVGVPPTSGFSSKWMIYHALMQCGQPFLALLSLVGSVLTLAYIAKFLHACFLGQPAADLDDIREVPLTMRVPMTILAVGCLLTGIFPGLALMPINAVLAEYGAGQLHVGLSGILSGAGAWNATGIFVMMALAFGGGYWFVHHFTRPREIDVHACGLAPEVATSRMTPSSIYGDLTHVLQSTAPATKENR